jgi:hypothetical protein
MTFTFHLFSTYRMLSDFLNCAVNSFQVPDFLENINVKKFVLVHGEGFGAWCWYKTIALLEEAGLVPIAIDLTGSGIDLADTSSVTTLAEYSKPLISYLENLPEDEQVSDKHLIPFIPINSPCTL